MAEERWSIGDLASASGVTLRTLYYYDEIGLVSASERTGAGHRRYTAADVQRLYRVRALTQLGLSLDEVATVLRSGAENLTALRDLLAAQLADLDVKARRINEVRQRVLGLVELLDGETMPEPERFLGTLEVTAQLHGHLSEQHWDALAARRAELGDDTVDALRAEWVTIVTELRRHLVNGTPARDSAVRELAGRWQRVAEAFRTGQPDLDERIQAAGEVVWRQHGARISEYVSDRAGWSAPGEMADIVDYVQRAMKS
ncbi:MerR family transcriptional regulator [Actinophytocola sp.]|uniref:MerR family transcriptional regulator n=1 Tax=Actinophytocola sp. TaxID=1872138 RepID=UPI002ED1F475